MSPSFLVLNTDPRGGSVIRHILGDMIMWVGNRRSVVLFRNLATSWDQSKESVQTEFKESQFLIVGTTIHHNNYGIPSALQTWGDSILSAGTISTKKTAVVVVECAAGDNFVFDVMTSHVVSVLYATGLEDIHLITIQDMTTGTQEFNEAQVAAAKEKIKEILITRWDTTPDTTEEGEEKEVVGYRTIVEVHYRPYVTDLSMKAPGVLKTLTMDGKTLYRAHREERCAEYEAHTTSREEFIGMDLQGDAFKEWMWERLKSDEENAGFAHLQLMAVNVHETTVRPHRSNQPELGKVYLRGPPYYLPA